MGVTLMTRTTHDLSLTPDGERLLIEAHGLLAGWGALTERFGDGGVRGPLKIVAPVGLGQGLLADIALEFLAANPGVTIDWLLDDGPVRFAESGCDLWIKVGAPEDDRLVIRPVADVTRIIVATPDIKALIPAPPDLSAAPFVALSPFEGGRITLTGPAGATALITPDVRFSTNNISALRRAALAGVGAAVAPIWFVREDITAGRLMDAAPGWRAPSLTITAAYAPGARRPKRLSNFLDALERGLSRLAG